MSGGAGFAIGILIARMQIRPSKESAAIWEELILLNASTLTLQIFTPWAGAMTLERKSLVSTFQPSALEIYGNRAFIGTYQHIFNQE